GEERTLLVDALTSDSTLVELTELRNRMEKLGGDISALPPPEKVYAAADYFEPLNEFKPARRPRPVHLLGRGDVKQPRELMLPGAIPAVPGPKPQFEVSDLNEEGLRRAALAKWITDPDNMLT